MIVVCIACSLSVPLLEGAVMNKVLVRLDRCVCSLRSSLEDVLKDTKIRIHRWETYIRLWIWFLEARCVLYLLKLSILFSQGGEKRVMERRYKELKAHENALKNLGKERGL